MFLLIASLTPLFMRLFEKKHLVEVPSNESYDRSLNRLDDIAKLTNYVDSIVKSKSITPNDTFAFVLAATEIVKKRFHYGFSNYTLAENWAAYFGGKLIWSHLSAIVDPNDILKHTEGLCSQQTIVFLDLLKAKGIPFRSVGLGPKEGPGHFICEVNYHGNWHMYDITMEPNWKAIKNSHNSMAYYNNNRDSLFLVYENKIPSEVLNKMLVQINYGKVNDMPAQNMLLFHNTSKAVVYILPWLLFWLCIRNYRRTS